MTKPKPVNVDEIDLDRMKLSTTDAPSILEYAHTLGGFSIQPTEEGVIKSNALSAMEQQTQMQMDQIYEQMQLLAEQAKKVQDRAQKSYKIYNAKMNFKPIVGKTYYLYEKNTQQILTILSPEEWGDKMPYDEFICRATLLSDHTWEIDN